MNNSKKMKKNKFSVKQDDGKEAVRWLKFQDDLVLESLIMQFQAIYLAEESSHYKKMIKIWSEYLIQDINNWKKRLEKVREQ